MPAIDFKKIGDGGGIFTRPLIQGETIYFGAFDKYFYALDANTGYEKWSVLANGLIMSSPAILDGVIYFGCFDNCLYAVSILEKRILWKLRTGDLIISSPVIENDAIYFGSCDNYLYSVSTKTGEVAWKFKAENEIIGDAVIDENKIYFGSTDNYFYCLELDGALIWKFRANGEFLVRAPAISGDIVYAAASDGCIYALGKKTGELIWKMRSGDESFNCISFDEKNIYFGSKDRHLYCMDKKTGAVNWKFRASQGLGTAPTITKDRIYFGADKIYALDKKGTLLWTYETHSTDFPSFTYSPSIHNGKLYFSSFDGYFRCIDDNGKLVWSFKVKSTKKVKVELGAINAASWWDERMFALFEAGQEDAADAPAYVLKKYGTDVLTTVEDNIEKYTGEANAYRELQSKTYTSSPTTYKGIIEKNEDDKKKMKQLFGV